MKKYIVKTHDIGEAGYFNTPSVRFNSQEDAEAYNNFCKILYGIDFKIEEVEE